jgi:hypothetical protein
VQWAVRALSRRARNAGAREETKCKHGHPRASVQMSGRSAGASTAIFRKLRCHGARGLEFVWIKVVA